MNIGNLSEKESRIMIMKMIHSSLSEEEEMNAQNEKLKIIHKELENIKNQTEVKGTINK